MSDSRYSPRAARVEDVSRTRAEGERPPQISTAIKLAAFNYALGLMSLAVSWDYYSRLQAVGRTIFSQLLSLVFLVWIYGKIYQGRNWARITLLVLSILGGLIVAFNSPAWQLLMAAPTMAKMHMLISLGVNIAVLWLIFSSPGKEWFQRAVTKPVV